MINANKPEKWNMEQFNRLPPRMRLAEVNRQLDAIFAVLSQLLDDDILFWIGREQTPAPEDVFRAATVIADRLCGAVSDPIIRNAQEERQH